MVKVSVIIPVYNSEKFIKETLDSVLNQTYKDFEIIVVDDGSEDNSKEIISEYVELYPLKVRYIYQSNKGPGAARNKGIEESSGDYIALIDADDLWLPSRLEEGMIAMENNPDISLVHAKTIRISDAGEKIESTKRNPLYLSGNIFEYLLLRKANISCLTILVEKSCLDDVGLFSEDPLCLGVEDRELLLRITKKYKVLFVDKVLGYYRIHKDGISRDEEKTVKKKIHVINEVCPEDGILKKQALASIYKELGDSYLLSEKYCEAKNEYIRSLKFWPYNIWPWINLMKSLIKFGVKRC